MSKRRARRVAAKRRTLSTRQELRAAQRAADAATVRQRQAEDRVIQQRTQMANSRTLTADPLIETIMKQMQQELAQGIARDLIAQDHEMACTMRHMILRASRMLGADGSLWHFTPDERFPQGIIEALMDDHTGSLRMRMALPPIQVEHLVDRLSLFSRY